MSRDAPLNLGIYSFSEAAKLSGVSVGRIRRWLRGYEYRSGKSSRHSGAVWQGQLKPIENRIALSFLDLMEVRFIAAFLVRGISWRTMRSAHTLACQELRSEHPFCTNRFVTDGTKLLLRQANESSDQALFDIATNQQELLRIVQPFLKELEFASDTQLSRWWPLGRDRTVILDPLRNFGQPSTVNSGVPTQALARAVTANKSAELVARWFHADPAEVSDAVEFERRLVT